ncbi:Protein fam72a [Dissophora globulifera]|uniref:Protein fam72a n=1 Tax=Dissophora globulifera TaxID=979702 RepID=A0A9P6R700_9FUNG|nr:Protein fam72a [Dissophora globulifera]
MDCRYCSAVVCLRGMKAMLLADTSVELYSTDHPPGSVQLIDKDYTTSNCKCKIRDVACRVCGNVVGYHITQPCQQCLKAPNNGHFWMFHTEGVVGQDRQSLDLGKLVQELVSPSNAPSSSSLPSRSPSSSARQRSHATASVVTSPPPSAAGPRLEASTSRMTSVARLEMQQRQRDRQQQAQTWASTGSPIRTGSTTSTPTLSSRIGTADNLNGDDGDDGLDQPPPPAASALAVLSLSQFLQPMTWEQLPPPDLDIDLDPSALDDEPLFAAQWVDLVTRTAEAAAANMCLALDQEEETSRYLERIVGGDRHDCPSPSLRDEEEEEEEEEEDEEVGEVEVEIQIEEIEEVMDMEQGELEAATEVTADGEIMSITTEQPHQRRRRRRRERQQREEAAIEELIDQVDEFGLTNSTATATDTSFHPIVIVAEDPKDDEIYQVLDMNGDPIDPSEGRRRLEREREMAQPDAAPAPSQQGPMSSPAASEAIMPALFTSTGSDGGGGSHRAERRIRAQASGRSSSSSSSSSSETTTTTACPAFALASVMAAQAAASAAAADAATAANSLLYGRRGQREYDMMCR